MSIKRIVFADLMHLRPSKNSKNLYSLSRSWLYEYRSTGGKYGTAAERIELLIRNEFESSFFKRNFPFFFRFFNINNFSHKEKYLIANDFMEAQELFLGAHKSFESASSSFDESAAKNLITKSVNLSKCKFINAQYISVYAIHISEFTKKILSGSVYNANGTMSFMADKAENVTPIMEQAKTPHKKTCVKVRAVYSTNHKKEEKSYQEGAPESSFNATTKNK